LRDDHDGRKDSDERAFFKKNIHRKGSSKSVFYIHFSRDVGKCSKCPADRVHAPGTFINAFDQPRPFQAMDFDGRADDLTAQSMRFQIEEVHKQISQKAAKEAKISQSKDHPPSFASFCSKSFPRCHDLH
jgi:hypothetical protein